MEGMATKTKTEKLETKTAETVLVLRTCQADGTSSQGFKWPESGTVKAYDWKPTKECGNGLHGWLWGHGDWGLKVKGDSIKWLVLEVAKDSIIDLSGKVKFPEANVIATFQNWWDAMKFIRSRHKDDEQTTIATGDYGHASATGYYGHASATGYYGHASATGDSGHASATGYSGHASATGDSGHASATGNYGHASATGYYGHASATGNYGWAVAGYNGDVMADKNGAIAALWWDDKDKRPRVLVGYVGEDGIKPNTRYRAENGKWVEVNK